MTVSSGDTVLLDPDLVPVEKHWDIRWTHCHLVLNKDKKTCHHRRCELLTNGTLRFEQVQPQDAGNYTVEVFDKEGIRQAKRYFLLQVEESSSSISSNNSVVRSVVTCFVLLLFLLLILIIFIVRRRSQSTTSRGQMEDNVYMAMHSHHGNTEKQEEYKKEDDLVYVPFDPAALNM
ncbi:uncharacterized protein LOC114445670 isoform X2 [Parambassis ranga]|nr:uncharacterized protein LOC114445670 isoform X2 [Parambassis ranga]